MTVFMPVYRVTKRKDEAVVSLGGDGCYHDEAVSTDADLPVPGTLAKVEVVDGGGWECWEVCSCTINDGIVTESILFRVTDTGDMGECSRIPGQLVPGQRYSMEVSWDA